MAAARALAHRRKCECGVRGLASWINHYAAVAVACGRERMEGHWLDTRLPCWTPPHHMGHGCIRREGLGRSLAIIRLSVGTAPCGGTPQPRVWPSVVGGCQHYGRLSPVPPLHEAEGCGGRGGTWPSTVRPLCRLQPAAEVPAACWTEGAHGVFTTEGSLLSRPPLFHGSRCASTLPSAPPSPAPQPRDPAPLPRQALLFVLHVCILRPCLGQWRSICRWSSAPTRSHICGDKAVPSQAILPASGFQHHSSSHTRIILQTAATVDKPWQGRLPPGDRRHPAVTPLGCPRTQTRRSPAAGGPPFQNNAFLTPPGPALLLELLCS